MKKKTFMSLNLKELALFASKPFDKNLLCSTPDKLDEIHTNINKNRTFSFAKKAFYNRNLCKTKSKGLLQSILMPFRVKQIYFR